MFLKRVVKFLKYLILCLAILFVFVLITINLPFSQRIISERANKFFVKKELPVKFDGITFLLNGKIGLRQVQILDNKQDTIVFAEKINVSAKLLPLIFRKVIVKNVTIRNSVVNLSTDSINGELNIISVFTDENRPSESGKKPGKKWEINVEIVDLENIRFSYNDVINGLRISQSAGKLSIGFDDFSIIRKQISARFIEIDQARGSLTIGNNDKNDDINAQAGIPLPWILKLERSDLKNIQFTIYQPDAGQRMIFSLGRGQVSDAGFDLAATRITAGKAEIQEGSVQRVVSIGDSAAAERFDPLQISDFNTVINDVVLSREEAGFNMRKLTFSLGNVLNIQKGEISMISDSIRGSKVQADMRTASSRLIVTIEAVKKLADIISSFREVPFALKIDNTEIDVAEIFTLFPVLKEQASWKNKEAIKIGIKCDVAGTVDDLEIKDLNLYTSTELSFSASGYVKGIAIPSSALCSVAFTTGEIIPRQLSDILSLFGKATEIPQFDPLTISGRIDSTLSKPVFNLLIKGGSGDISLNGSVDIGRKDYSLGMSFSGVDIGRVTGAGDFGRASGRITLNGKDYDPLNMKIGISLSIDTAEYKGYEYRGIKLTSDGDKGNYSFGLKSAGNSFNCDLKGSIDLNDSSVGGNIAGLMKVDAGKLNLYEGSTLSADINGYLRKSAGLFEASLSLKDLIVSRHNKTEDLKNVELSFLSSDSLSRTKIDADFIKADAYYRGSPGEFLKLVKENRIRGFAVVDSTVGNKIPYLSSISEMKISVESFYDPFIGLFVNDTVFSYNTISAAIQKDNSGIAKAELWIDRINAGRSKVSGASVIIESLNDKSVLEIRADSVRFGNICLSNIRADFTMKEDTATFRAEARSTTDSLLYDISGTALKGDGEIKLRSDRREWIINGYKWNISTGDFLILESLKNDFKADLHLIDNNHSIDIYGRKSERLYIETREVGLNRLLVPGIENFRYDGILSGKVDYRSNDGNNELGIQMDIEEIMMDKNLLGKLEFTGNYISDSLGNIQTDLNAVINDTSDLKLYFRSEKKKAEKSIRAEFSDIQLHHLESLVRKYVKGLKGRVSGNLEVISRDDQPRLNGNIKIAGTSLKLIPLNAWYYLSDDIIKIDNNKLTFSRFTVRDSMRNPLILSGSLNLNDPANVTADLQMTSSHIQVMNTTEKENASFNGSIYIDSRINIKGPLQKPSIDGNIVLSGGTVINYRYAENLSVSETGKTITFANLKQDRADTILIKPVSNPMSGSPDIEATVEINPNSLFNFQISKGFDIGVSITGGGFLTYSLMPNKDIDLSGIYEINQGTSQLKIPGWPRKDFIITKGSIVKWDGKIDDPDLSLETTSKVRGSYVNPVDNKTREVNFLVIMKLTGRLSELEILFDVRSEDQYITTFFNTLSEDERMRQAINLLIFERVELPGQTSSSNYLTQQVSQFAENQLNQATKSASKKLDLDVSVGLDTYTRSTTTGEQTTTSLSYQVKKDMFKDRGSVLLSGHTNYNTTADQQSNAVIENFIFEYAIDTNRTKFLKVYRQQNYEDLLEGEVIKSGVGFIYRKNYDRITDIWRRQKKGEK